MCRSMLNACAAGTLLLWTFLLACSGTGQVIDQRSVYARPAPATYTSHARVAPKTLEVSRAIGSENTFGMLFIITALDDKLLVIDRTPLVGSERLLVVDRSTGLVERRAAPYGQGPGDVQTVLSIAPVPDRANTFSVYDYMNKRFTFFELDPWGGPVDYVVHSDGVQTLNAAWLGGGRVVMNGTSADHLLRFYTVDESGDALRFERKVGSSVFPSVPPRAQRLLNYNKLAVRPDRKVLVVAFTFANRLYFFDSDGNLLRTIAGPVEVLTRHFEDGRLDIAGGAQVAYLDVDATTDHVYALFGDGDVQLGEGTTIHVFTWNGDLVEIYRLGRPINFLTVAEDSRSIFGVTNEPFPQIVEFAVSSGFPAEPVRR